MATIPKHFEEAFPWINNPPPKIKVSSPTTVWLEKEIIRIIFRNTILTPSDEGVYDPVLQLIEWLSVLKEEEQVSYIKAVAKCLAEAVVDTHMRRETKGWLNDVRKMSQNLSKVLKQIPKRNLPANYNNLFTIVLRVIDSSNIPSNTKLSKISDAVKDARLSGVMSEGINKTHGILDLVAILNLVSKQSKALIEKNSAIFFYKYPQTFFEEISKDNKFRKAYQRIAIQSISAVNQEHFDEPKDALTAHILTCVFHIAVNEPNVTKIRKNTKAK